MPCRTNAKNCFPSPLTCPVTALARGESRKAAALPTSRELNSFWMGAFSYEYLRKHNILHLSHSFSFFLSYSYTLFSWR